LLRARAWDTDDAQKLCDEILEYRTEQSLDTVLTLAPENPELTRIAKVSSTNLQGN
jgi:hypothetical protein